MLTGTRWGFSCCRARASGHTVQATGKVPPSVMLEIRVLGEFGSIEAGARTLPIWGTDRHELFPISTQRHFIPMR